MNSTKDLVSTLRLHNSLNNKDEFFGARSAFVVDIYAEDAIIYV
jgi:hypothetical protein